MNADTTPSTTPQATPWNPPQTAPKDGTEILAFYGNGDYGIIKWTNNWNEDGSGEWTDPFCDQVWMPPTFWQHLPPPPDA